MKLLNPEAVEAWLKKSKDSSIATFNLVEVSGKEIKWDFDISCFLPSCDVAGTLEKWCDFHHHDHPESEHHIATMQFISAREAAVLCQ